MKKPVEIWLSHEEVTFCWDVAEIRQGGKQIYHPTLGHMNLAHTPKGSHFFGVLAEQAAARLMGGEVSMEAFPYGGDKHEPDFIDRWGRKIEAKASTYQRPDCMLKLEHDELFDDIHYCHCLLTVPDRVVVYPAIAGWLVRKHSFIKNFGYGDRFAIRADRILEIVNSEEGREEAQRWKTGRSGAVRQEQPWRNEQKGKAGAESVTVEQRA